VRRAAAVLVVDKRGVYAHAAQESGLRSITTVADLVARFNRHGLAAIGIARGRGRKATYQAAQRAQLVATAQREPDRRSEGTGTWSLSTLQRCLRQAGLPQVGTSTAGCRMQRQLARSASRWARGRRDSTKRTRRLRVTTGWTAVPTRCDWMTALSGVWPQPAKDPLSVVEIPGQDNDVTQTVGAIANTWDLVDASASTLGASAVAVSVIAGPEAVLTAAVVNKVIMLRQSLEMSSASQPTHMTMLRAADPASTPRFAERAGRRRWFFANNWDRQRHGCKRGKHARRELLDTDCAITRSGLGLGWVRFCPRLWGPAQPHVRLQLHLFSVFVVRCTDHCKCESAEEKAGFGGTGRTHYKQIRRS
jgi:transposase